MSDHREGPRLVNALFPVFEGLPARQQAVFVQLMGGPAPSASDVSDAELFSDSELAEEVEEAKAHFRTKLGSMGERS